MEHQTGTRKGREPDPHTDRNRTGLEKMNRKPGDWNCRSCQHLNFSRRDSCQRCGEPRSDRGDFASFGGGRGGGGSSFGFSCSDVRPGDWYCTCGAHNFASRSSCFKCGAFKDDAAVGSGASGGGFEGGDLPRSRGYGFGSGGGGGGGGAPAGSPATGFAPGRAATSTTLRAGWNASDAMPLGNQVLRFEEKSKRDGRMWHIVASQAMSL